MYTVPQGSTTVEVLSESVGGQLSESVGVVGGQLSELCRTVGTGLSKDGAALESLRGCGEASRAKIGLAEPERSPFPAIALCRVSGGTLGGTGGTGRHLAAPGGTGRHRGGTGRHRAAPGGTGRHRAAPGGTAGTAGTGRHRAA